MEPKFTSREKDLIAAAIRAEIALIQSKQLSATNPETIVPKFWELRIAEYKAILNKTYGY